MLAGFVQGALGLGFPLIAFFTDIRIAVIIVLPPCVATILMTIRKAALHGMKIRNRLDAPTYRLWLKRGLFGVAVMPCAQHACGLARG